MQNESKKNILRLIKQLLVLTIIFSIVLTLILIPIRFEYEQVAPLKEAKYHIFVNGKITKHDYTQVLEDPNIVNAAVASYGSGNVYKGTINDTYIETTIPVNTVLLVNHETLKDQSKLDIIGLNHFLISGNLMSGYPDFRYASISWSIAKRLGVDIGDTVIYWVGNSKYEYTISGITNPTSETEFIVEDISAFDPIEEERYAGNLYIVTENQKATMKYIQSYITENKKDWALTTIEDQKNRVSTTVKESLPPIIRIWFVAGGLFLYLVVLLREQNIVISNKNRNFSILTALGTSKKELMKIYAIEQIFIMVTVTFFAALASKFLLYQALFKLYLPIEVVFHGAAIGLVLNVIAVMVALFYTTRKINKVPVAELLREG